MASKGEFRYTYDEEGNEVLQRYGVHPDTGEGRWIDRPSEEIEGYTMEGARRTKRNMNIATRNIEQARNRARTANMQGDAAVIRERIASDIPAVDLNPLDWDDDPSRASIRAGRETDKLVAGVRDLQDFGQSILRDTPVLNKLTAPGRFVANLVLGDEDEAEQRTFDRAEEQAEKDKYYEPISERMGLEAITSMAPYMVSNFAGPAAAKAGSRAISGIEQGVKTGAAETGGLTARGISNVARRDIPGASPLAREVEEKIVIPMREGAQARKARPPIRHEFREGAGGEMVGSAGIGGLEGGAHYDESILDGLYSSMLGTGVGKMHEPFMSRMPGDRLSKMEQDTIDWAESQGYRALPGMKTGQPRLQNKEAGLRNDERYSGAMNQLDRANDEVVTKVVADTIGIPPENMKGLTTQQLQDHLDNLSSQYKALEAGSTGKVTLKDLGALKIRIKELPDTKEGNRLAAKLQDAIDMVEGLAKKPAQRDARGRYKAVTFDGSEYQDARSILSSQMDKAWQKGDKALYNEIKRVRDTLDVGMERGVNKYGGKASVGQWKDLNERYAMTKLILNNGMNPVGGIDLNRLGSHIQTTDMERLLTGKGGQGRIANLHNLVRLNHVQKNQRGNTLSGAGIEKAEKEDLSEKARLLATPNVVNVPLRRWAQLRAYQSGWPQTSGLLGLPRNSPGSLPNLLRALEQGSDVHVDTAKSGYEKVGGAVESGQDILQNMINYVQGGYDTGE